MSTTAAALLEELKKLPREEQEEILLQLQRLHSAKPHSAEPHSAEPHSAEPHSAEPHSAEPQNRHEKFPIEILPGGPITSQQVADALD